VDPRQTAAHAGVRADCPPVDGTLAIVDWCGASVNEVVLRSTSRPWHRGGRSSCYSLHRLPRCVELCPSPNEYGHADRRYFAHVKQSRLRCKTLRSFVADSWGKKQIQPPPVCSVLGIAATSLSRSTSSVASSATFLSSRLCTLKTIV
jgi:hypothetical protein